MQRYVVRASSAIVARRRLSFFFFNATATTEIYTLSLHDALPIFEPKTVQGILRHSKIQTTLDLYTQEDRDETRSEEHTSELQSHHDLVCRLLLEKKKKKTPRKVSQT